MSNVNDATADSEQAWTRYWRTGKPASCFGGAAAEARFAGIWAQFADSLADGARILDLATGNGAAIGACAARAHERGLELDMIGVDAADIDPARDAADAGLPRDIAFRGGVRLEALPFADAEFDGVISQFGFEYAGQVPAAAEAARVLAAGGRMRLVVHARDGAIVQDIRNRLDRLERVVSKQGPLTLVIGLVHAVEHEDRRTLERESARLGHAETLVRELAQQPPSDDAALFYAGRFLETWHRHERYEAAELRVSLEDAYAAARALALRQAQMLDAAHDADAMGRLAARLESHGLSAHEPVPVTDGANAAQIAWLLDASRSA